MYRLTKKAAEARARHLEAMRRGKDRARMARPAPEYPLTPPMLRLRITVERFDPGAESAHVFELRRSRRVDQFVVLVDGQPWATCGLSRVLAGLRKATPRLLSPRRCD